MRRLPTSLAQPVRRDSPSAVPQTQGGSAHCLLGQLTSQLAQITPHFQRRGHQDTCDRCQLPLKDMGGVLATAAPDPGPRCPPAGFPAASRSGPSSTLVIRGEGAAAHSCKPAVEPKFVRMLPARLLYLAKDWQLWTEQGGEGRGKGLHVKNTPGTTRSVGRPLRDLAVSGTGGAPPSPNLGQVHLDSLQREKQFLVELGEG